MSGESSAQSCFSTIQQPNGTSPTESVVPRTRHNTPLGGEAKAPVSRQTTRPGWPSDGRPASGPSWRSTSVGPPRISCAPDETRHSAAAVRRALPSGGAQVPRDEKSRSATGLSSQTRSSPGGGEADGLTTGDVDCFGRPSPVPLPGRHCDGEPADEDGGESGRGRVV
jgi:hypothetical protein